MVRILNYSNTFAEKYFLPLLIAKAADIAQDVMSSELLHLTATSTHKTNVRVRKVTLRHPCLLDVICHEGNLQKVSIQSMAVVTVLDEVLFTEWDKNLHCFSTIFLIHSSATKMLCYRPGPCIGLLYCYYMRYRRYTNAM